MCVMRALLFNSRTPPSNLQSGGGARETDTFTQPAAAVLLWCVQLFSTLIMLSCGLSFVLAAYIVYVIIINNNSYVTITAIIVSSLNTAFLQTFHLQLHLINVYSLPNHNIMYLYSEDNSKLNGNILPLSVVMCTVY